MQSDVIEGYALSPQQRRLWSTHGAGAVPRATLGLRLQGALDTAALERALRVVVAGHEILRTQLRDFAGLTLPLQVVAESLPVALQTGAAAGADVAVHYERLLAQLPDADVLQAALGTLAPDEHLLALAVPGMQADLASLDALARALCTAYAAERSGTVLAAPAVQYAQYAQWRNEAAEAEAPATAQASTAAQPLRLPFETSAADSAPADASVAVTVCAALGAAVRAACARQRCSQADFWLAAWCALLARLTQRDDIRVAVATDGRVFDELADAIGLFDQAATLGVSVARDDRYAELCAAVASARRVLAEEVSAGLPVTVDADLPAVAFESLALSDLDGAGLRVQLYQPAAPAGHGRLTLSCLTDSDGAVQLRLAYDASRHAQADIARVAQNLLVLAEHAATAPDTRIDDLELLAADERRELLHTFNATQQEIGTALTHQLIDVQSRGNAGPAVIATDETLSYAELARASDQLAVHLQGLGVGPESRVAVCLRRSPQLIVTLLAVLKAGAAYVPLDPDDPPQRLNYVLDDAAPALLLLDSAIRDELKPEGVPLLVLDTDAERIAANTGTPKAEVQPDHPAYLIYTSGSTGKPKGAVITHRGLLNYLQWACRHYRVGEGSGAMLHSPATFDLAVTTLFAPLMAGRPLHLLARDADLGDLVRAIEAAQDWSFIKLTPAHLELLAAQLTPEAARAARVIIIGGEALHGEQVAFWRKHAPQVRLINEYGPTETVVGCCIYEVGADDPSGQAVPIGRPIDNTQLYVFDERLRPVPAGVTGELYIGGLGVARGYHRRPALTAERFIPDPHATTPGARLYRTGDAVRLRASGELEFLGRRDEQVKIRGYRVELGEIENVLRNHAGVRECAVIQRQDIPGDPRLTAYLVLRPDAQDTGHAALRAHLLERLPEYMVPARFVFLDALPVTRGGKVDRKALPEPDDSRDFTGPRYQAPQLFAEEVLATIWSDVLRVDRVGIDDNFFALGGDSIRSIRIRAQAQQRGLVISTQDILQHQTIRQLARQVGFGAGTAFTPAARLQLVDTADRERLPAAIEDAMPLAALQTGMVFHSEYAPESAVFHDVHSIELQIPFDEGALRMAVGLLFERHPMLRASFDLAGYSRPLLLVHRTVPLPLDIEDVRELPRAEQSTRIAQWLDGEKHRVIDWTVPPLLRFKVHRRSDDTCRFGFSFHHAVLDGWSVANLLTELFRTYLELHDGLQPSAPPAEPVTFADFVALEKAAIDSAQTQAYWDGQLAGNSALALPRAAAGTQSGIHIEHIAIPLDVSQGLKQLSRTLSVPIKSVLLAAHLRVLGHWTGHADVVTGLVSNGRPEVAGGDRIAGLFLNSLPFRQRLGAASWSELVRDVFDTERDMLPHRRYPLAHLQQRHGGRRLFDTAFNFMHYHVYQSLENLRDDVKLLDWGGYEETDFPLTANFSLDLASSQVMLLLNCHRAEFDEAHIRRIAASYVQVLTAMAADPEAAPTATDLLGADERRDLLETFNATQQEIGTTLVHQLIDAQSRGNAGPAVIATDETLSYAELARASDQLAVHLQGLGVGPESRVAVCLRRSPQLIVTLLAVLKAGAAYVPLDPDDPPQRLNYVLDDAAPALLLLDSAIRDELKPEGVPLLVLDTEAERIAANTGTPKAEVQPDHPAYLIYTSGSTGKPKGAVITHRGLLNYLQWACRHYRVGEGGGAMLHSPATFDLAVTTLFAPLMSGRPLHLLARDADLGDLVRAIEAAQDWSFIKLTPAHLELLAAQLTPEAARAARVIVIGGEALHGEQVAFWRRHAPQVRLINEYGPTETVVGCCIYEVGADDPSGQAVPIGRPIDNTQLYVFDERLRPVPAGVTGELYIGGLGVARGYHRRPALTAERFIPDPHATTPGARLYRTGDAVRLRASGELEFLGRRDEQVKIRGYRVELGEIENVLRNHAGVRECAVILRQDIPGDPRLTAYLVLRPDAQDTGHAALRAHLLERLPEYMVPARFVVLDALPVTRGGKVDRKALPKPDDSRDYTGREFIAPRTELETTLAAIWTEVLTLDRVGVHDNFFELGGHSLPAVQIASRIRQALAIELPLRQLFDFPTIEQLAGRITAIRAGGRATAGSPIVPRRQRVTAATVDLDALLGELETLSDEEARQMNAAPADVDANPLTFDQERVWNLEQDNQGRFRYTLSFMFRLRGALDASALERAVAEIVQRHEVLRSTFALVDGRPAQIVAPTLDVPLVHFDLSADAAREDSLQEHTAQASRVPFDLARGPLVRASLYRLAPEEHALSMLMHAIVMDGWSMGILLRELSQLYYAYSHGETPALPPLTIQVADYAHWERQEIGSAHLAELRDYWLRQLPGPLVPLRLPGRRDVPASERGATQTLALPAPLAQRLREFAREQGATPFMVAIAAFQLLLRERCAQDAVSLGLGVAVRDRVETEALIGSFMNILLLRTEFDASQGFSDAVQRVRDTMLGAFAHQNLPWVEVVRALREDGRLPEGTPTRIMADHLTIADDTQDVAGLRVSTIAPERQQQATGSDLTFRLQERGEQLAITFFYKSDLFEDALIGALLDDLQRLLQRGLDAPTQPIAGLLDAKEYN